MSRWRMVGSVISLVLLALPGAAAGDTADPGPPCELQWLDPFEAPGSRFPNYACHIDDQLLVLGDADLDFGAVHIYRREGLTWVYDELLLPDKPIEDIAFGYRIALDGDRLLVGAPLYGSIGDHPGAVYAFRRIGGDWVEEEIIVPGDEPSRAWFGSEIAISGNLAAVAASSRDNGAVYDAGAIYIFEDSGSGWTEQGLITLPDPREDEMFGRDLAFAGERIFAAQRWRDHSGVASGSVYIFKEDGASWIEEDVIWADDAEQGDLFGFDVAADGDRVLVGAPGSSGPTAQSGIAHIFRNDGGNWVEEDRLVDSESWGEDYLGSCVEFTAGLAIVGIPRFQPFGSCLIFEQQGSQWLPAERVSPTLEFDVSAFGSGLSCHGGFLLVSGQDNAAVYGTTSETCCPLVLVAPGPAEANPARIRAFDTYGNPYAATDFTAYQSYGYGVRLTTGRFLGYNDYPEIITGPGPGENNPPRVSMFSNRGQHIEMDFTAYGVPKYGVNVACGDLDGDGDDEIVTGAGPGAVFGPHVRGWRWEDDVWPMTNVNFLAYGTNKYGVNVACGDIDADGMAEIITGAGPGAVFGPHVRGWDVDGGTAAPIPGVNYFAYGTPKWGVNVACGDIDGDGYDEIITGAGPGAVFGPHVRAWNHDGSGIAPIPGVSYFAYGTNKFGVRVTAGDLDYDGIDEIVTTPGPGAVFGSHVRGWNYDGQTLSAISTMSFFAYDGSMRYGADVALLDR